MSPQAPPSPPSAAASLATSLLGATHHRIPLGTALALAQDTPGFGEVQISPLPGSPPATSLVPSLLEVVEHQGLAVPMLVSSTHVLPESFEVQILPAE